MRRVIPFFILVLAVYSTVIIAQGNRQVYAPIIYKAGLPPTVTVTEDPASTPTATSTLPSLPPELLPNGDFEQGDDGTWNTYSGNAIQKYPEQLPEAPFQGEWAARFVASDSESNDMSQYVVVPVDRPFITFRAKVVSSNPECPVFPDANIDLYQVRVCAETASYGWFVHSIDYREFVGEEIFFAVTGGHSGELWVDQIEWTSQPVDSTAPPEDQPQTGGVDLSGESDHRGQDGQSWYFQGKIENSTLNTIYNANLLFKFYNGQTLLEERSIRESLRYLLPNAESCYSVAFAKGGSEPLPENWDRYEVSVQDYFITQRTAVPLDISNISVSPEVDEVAISWQATNNQASYVEDVFGAAYLLDSDGNVTECNRSIYGSRLFLYQGEYVN